jgi:hypothetical protein
VRQRIGFSTGDSWHTGWAYSTSQVSGRIGEKTVRGVGKTLTRGARGVFSFLYREAVLVADFLLCFAFDFPRPYRF